MDRWIKSLSARNEFVFVLVLAFAWPVFASLTAVAYPQPPTPISGAGLASILALEIPVLAVIAVFLSLRGWNLAMLGPAPGKSDLPLGLALAMLTSVLFSLLLALAPAFGLNLPRVDEAVPVAKDIGWPMVIAVSAVNGFYEEVLVCGYLITAMRGRRSLWTAIHLSTAIRTAYHLYQGSIGVVSIVPMGLLYAWLYARTGRLWPLVVAHIVLDLLALGVTH
ncbi:CPBP family intramembrane glutamic endopeptidase [Lysobacter sp. CA196]|uniref:CPBP family intramembrane glutamic endopeptidase n=1 Tax=Lysobacter sp. CA196 TaxID=3455606 RepID=UPI003F8D8ECA